MKGEKTQIQLTRRIIAVFVSAHAIAFASGELGEDSAGHKNKLEFIFVTTTLQDEQNKGEHD